MDGSFDRQVLAKLPLAEAVLLAMRHVFDAVDLAALYEANRGRGYVRKLDYADLVGTLWDALTGARESVREELVDARDAGRLPVSLTAFYQKLAHAPLDATRESFRRCAAKLQELFPDDADRVGEALRDWTVLTLDGKTIKHVERRRPALRLDRENAARLLGGRALVARDRWTGAAVDLELDPDGEANEIKHVAALVRSLAAGRSRFLIVADRAFGVFEVARVVRENGGHFLFRKHGTTRFVPDPDGVEKRSTDRFGRVVVQRRGWIVRGKATAKKPAERIAVRQIVVERDQENLTLITSLLDDADCPVDALLEAYLDRWDIEKMFQVVTETFGLKRLASTSPQGVLLQLALCLLAHDVVQLVKAYVARSRNLPASEVSDDMLFRDVARDLVAASRVLPAASVADLVPPRTVEDVRSRLRELLDGLWRDRWRKRVGRPRDPSRPPRPKPPRIKQTKSHDSVYRILNRQPK